MLLRKEVLPSDLLPSERSVVVKVYRKYSRGKWYESETPKEGYNIISYYATKVRVRLYHSDREDALEDARKYNKRLAAYKQGKNPLVDYDLIDDSQIPEIIAWKDLPRAIRNPFLWPHNNSSEDDLSWLYEHADDYSEAWDDWKVRRLLKEETKSGMDRVFKAGNTTRKFFELIFANDTKYAGYDLYYSKSNNRWYVIRPV